MSSDLPNNITTTAAAPRAVTNAAVAKGKAAARGAQRVVKPGAPQKPVSPVSSANDPLIIDDSKARASKNMRGVGGELAKFRLSMVVRNPTNGQLQRSEHNYVEFEMAPARRSFADKQGQMVPGVGAGMEMPIEMSLAELKVPGSRPVMQPMGIAGEYIELVGAFIGYDEYMGNDNALGFDSKAARNRQGWDAWEKSQLFAQLVRSQREVYLTLEWEGQDYSHRILFQSGKNAVSFRGHIKKAKRIYASPQRVYYYIKLAVNNREDINAYPDSSGGGIYYLPESLAELGAQAIPADLVDAPAAAGTTAAAAVNDAHSPDYTTSLLNGGKILTEQEAYYATNSVDQADIPDEVKTTVKAYITSYWNSSLYSSAQIAAMEPKDLQANLEGLRNTETSLNIAREKINSDPHIGAPGKQAVDKVADAVKVESRLFQEAMKAKGVAPTTSKPAAVPIPFQSQATPRIEKPIF